MANLFERLAKERPPPINKAQELLPTQQAQKLLNWLARRWTKQTIRLYEICTYGPRSMRDRRSAMRAAMVLAEHGWLLRNKTRRYDSHEWEIIRKPVLYPITMAETPY